MAKTRRRPAPKLEITERDYVMARLAAARSTLADALAAVDESIELFTNPDEDKSGKKRTDALDAALEAAGAASRALEAADEVMPEVDFKEREPWDDENEDDDSEDEDTEEDDEEDDETDPEDD